MLRLLEMNPMNVAYEAACIEAAETRTGGKEEEEEAEALPQGAVDVLIRRNGEYYVHQGQPPFSQRSIEIEIDEDFGITKVAHDHSPTVGTEKAFAHVERVPGSFMAAPTQGAWCASLGCR